MQTLLTRHAILTGVIVGAIIRLWMAHGDWRPVLQSLVQRLLWRQALVLNQQRPRKGAFFSCLIQPPMTILPIPAAAPLARVQHINITVLGPIHLKQTVLIECQRHFNACWHCGLVP